MQKSGFAPCIDTNVTRTTAPSWAPILEELSGLLSAIAQSQVGPPAGRGHVLDTTDVAVGRGSLRDLIWLRHWRVEHRTMVKEPNPLKSPVENKMLLNEKHLNIVTMGFYKGDICMQNSNDRKAGLCLRTWGTVMWFVLILWVFKYLCDLCINKCISLRSENPKYFPNESSIKIRDLGITLEFESLYMATSLTDTRVLNSLI